MGWSPLCLDFSFYHSPPLPLPSCLGTLASNGTGTLVLRGLSIFLYLEYASSGDLVTFFPPASLCSNGLLLRGLSLTESKAPLPESLKTNCLLLLRLSPSGFLFFSLSFLSFLLFSSPHHPVFPFIIFHHQLLNNERKDGLV